jgi:hypothetical protein
MPVICDVVSSSGFACQVNEHTRHDMDPVEYSLREGRDDGLPSCGHEYNFQNPMRLSAPRPASRIFAFALSSLEAKCISAQIWLTRRVWRKGSWSRRRWKVDGRYGRLHHLRMVKMAR